MGQSPLQQFNCSTKAVTDNMQANEQTVSLYWLYVSIFYHFLWMLKTEFQKTSQCHEKWHFYCVLGNYLQISKPFLVHGRYRRRWQVKSLPTPVASNEKALCHGLNDIFLGAEFKYLRNISLCLLILILPNYILFF